MFWENHLYSNLYCWLLQQYVIVGARIVVFGYFCSPSSIDKNLYSPDYTSIERVIYIYIYEGGKGRNISNYTPLNYNP